MSWMLRLVEVVALTGSSCWTTVVVVVPTPPVEAAYAPAPMPAAASARAPIRMARRVRFTGRAWRRGPRLSSRRASNVAGGLPEFRAPGYLQDPRLGGAQLGKSLTKDSPA